MVVKKSFRKGVHPYGGKELAAEAPIRSIPAEDIMVYPVRQCIGAPSKPIVQKGDRVVKGQMIAEAGGFISAPIYASVSGTVKAIEPRAVTDGSRVDCIVVENDGLEDAVEGFGVPRELDEVDRDDIIGIVRDAGIVGMGGAGFPTSVKIAPKNADDIDYLIINGAECEPYLTSDYRLMLEKGDEIIKGIKAVLKALPAAQAVIGIEDNKPIAIKAMMNKTSKEENISVCPLKTKYPQGGERQLIYAITGRRLNSKMLPADKGCIVVNIASCYAIYEAVYCRMPLIHRVMTVTGDAVNAPCNIDTPLGVSHSYVLEQAGGADNIVKLISGGPMMGMAMSTLEVPVVKTSSSILAMTQDDVAKIEPSNCIHCGKCALACPQRLIPQMMGRAVKTDNIEMFERCGGMECIECGCCAYGCPAKIPLTQMFKLGKAKLREQKTKA